MRYGDFFDALAGRFDGTWSYDDADLAVLSLPVLAAREDASAAFRLLLEDLGHYGVARKDRDDQGMTVYLEEFSAVSDGARAAIDLAERLRDAGVGVVFVVQSYEGLGDEHQAARLLASSAALIVHRMPQPERLLAAAGTIWTPEQTWQLDQWGPDGQASVRMQQRPLVDPDAVRRAEVGEAWIIAAGRSLHLQVAETPYTPQPAELPSPTATASPSSRSGRRGSSTCPTRSQQRPQWLPGSCPRPGRSCRPRPGRSCRPHRRSCPGCASSSPPPSARATSWPCAESSSEPPGSRPPGTPRPSWPS